MKQIIEAYFIAEKKEALFFIIIGAISMIAAANCWFAIKLSFWKGAVIPLFVLGCVELAAGYIVHKRSDSQRIENVYAADMNPEQLTNKELPRMQTVVDNFEIYRYIEIFLAIAGLALISLHYTQPQKYFWAGLGAGLLLQSIILLIADHFAAQRAISYLNALSEFTKNL